MKRAAAYYLLLFYTVALFKPVMPIVFDVLAHQFNKAEHILQMHQHKGSYHLHAELLESSSSNKENNSNLPVRKTEPVSVHLYSIIVHWEEPKILAKTFYPLFTAQLLHTSLSITTPPPKV